jgi:hypothetical protein
MFDYYIIISVYYLNIAPRDLHSKVLVNNSCYDTIFIKMMNTTKKPSITQVNRSILGNNSHIMHHVT